MISKIVYYHIILRHTCTSSEIKILKIYNIRRKWNKNLIVRSLQINRTIDFFVLWKFYELDRDGFSKSHSVYSVSHKRDIYTAEFCRTHFSCEFVNYIYIYSFWNNQDSRIASQKRPESLNSVNSDSKASQIPDWRRILSK